MSMEDTLKNLNDREVRVLGCLFEKEMATPEYYPLTLNSLTTACNQKTNRHPVVNYDEATVRDALDNLRRLKAIRQSNVGRVVKFEQIFSESRQLTPREKAILCILLLRGPQTIGEVRGRTERLYSFNDLEEVRQTIQNLIDMELVAGLPVQPGRKEARYTQLLGQPTKDTVDNTADYKTTTAGRITAEDTLTALQHEVDQLKHALEQLREEFQSFKTQFD